MMFEITSKKYGKFEVLIDDEDWDRINKYCWCVKKDYGSKYENIFYVYGRLKKGSSSDYSNRMLLHRLIMRAPKNLKVDHIEHNTLDNRKENLRLADDLLSARHVRKTKKETSSIYKGVCYHKIIKKWQASISINHKRKHIGYFITEKDAALAYNNYIKVHGLNHLPNIIVDNKD